MFVDQYGRQVVVDRNGNVVVLEQPRRQQARERREQNLSRRGAIIDAPPPPGVTLEGPIRMAPPPGVYGAPGFEEPGYRDEATVPPFEGESRGGPIEARPLPAPDGYGMPDALPGASPSETAAIPGDTGLGLPDPGASILGGPGAVGEGATVHESRPAPTVPTPKGPNAKAEIAAIQVILDRAGMSPGVIDGRTGSNVNKAAAAYEEKYGRPLPTGDPRAIAEELDASGGPAIVTYEITAEDVSGPYVASIPSDYGEKALLPAMSYERVTEMLGERFHMDEAYLKEINPGADFTRPGTRVKVAAVGETVKGEVVRIEADKGREQVRAYGADGTLIAAYPSTIGSSDTPSPSGTVQVSRIAFDPNYTYNPKINFKQGTNDKILTIPPGPNGPVGTIWVALSKPTYGIHGTPEPSQIGKTNSHGCVRLTNWDAAELAKMVKPGTTVEFIE
ncbi:ATP synthase [Aurantimonas sp. Leaf443]|nr:ATP synthase [Aurantimonas sp. Leaf443]